MYFSKVKGKSLGVSKPNGLVGKISFCLTYQKVLFERVLVKSLETGAELSRMSWTDLLVERS